MINPAHRLRVKARAVVAPLLVLVAVALPKCVLCLLGYAGLVTSLGWGGVELCGGAGERVGSGAWLAVSATGLGTVAAIALGRALGPRACGK